MSAPSPEEMRRFLDAYLYEEAGFLIDEVVRLDGGERRVEARTDTTRPLPYSALQRTSPRHPAHVAAADLLSLTGNLGCLHAWFFHRCRFDEGWSGFGNRIHRADFRALTRIGDPLRLESAETRTRVGPRRIVMRLAFRFWQGETLVYRGDQSATFVHDFEHGA